MLKSDIRSDVNELSTDDSINTYEGLDSATPVLRKVSHSYDKSQRLLNHRTKRTTRRRRTLHAVSAVV